MNITNHQQFTKYCASLIVISILIFAISQIFIGKMNVFNINPSEHSNIVSEGESLRKIRNIKAMNYSYDELVTIGYNLLEIEGLSLEETSALYI